MHDVIITTVVSVLMPSILIGNILVIVSVVKFKKLRIPANAFVVSLAVADILLGAILPLYLMVMVLHQMPSLCATVQWCIMALCGTSLLNLAAIGYDRYAAIQWPLQYINIMSTRKITLLITFTWLYSAVISAGLCWGWESDSKLHNMSCHTDTPTHWHIDTPPQSTDPCCSYLLINKRGLLLNLVLVFLPSVSIIIYCYTNIYLIASKHARAIHEYNTQCSSSIPIQFMVKDTKYAKTLGIVIGLFMLLWGPSQLCIIIDISTDSEVNTWIRNYLILLTFVNSAVNPWIYPYKTKDFKTAYRRICRSLPCCKSKPTQSRANSMMSSTRNLSRTDSRIGNMLQVIYSLDTDYNSGSNICNNRSDSDNNNRYGSMKSYRHCGIVHNNNREEDVFYDNANTGSNSRQNGHASYNNKRNSISSTNKRQDNGIRNCYDNRYNHDNHDGTSTRQLGTNTRKVSITKHH